MKNKFPLTTFFQAGLLLSFLLSVPEILAFSLQEKLDTLLYVGESEFILGSPTSYYDEDEYPPNRVTLPGYYISSCPVTNKEYTQFLNDWLAEDKIKLIEGNIYLQDFHILLAQTFQSDEDTPVTFEGEIFSVMDGYDFYPVIEVTWYGALAYTEWLNERYGLSGVYNFRERSFKPDIAGFRLPTEYEWEKAAGWDPENMVKSRYGFQGDELSDKVANYITDESGILRPPPRLTPVGYYNGVNPRTETAVSYYGGYDFSGNVYEWCLDSYRRDYYGLIFRTGMTHHPWWHDRENPFAVTRGGAWLSYPEELRVANRSHFRKRTHCNFIGFRIAYGKGGNEAP